MEKEYTILVMEINMKATFWMMQDMAKEFITMTTGINSKENLFME